MKDLEMLGGFFKASANDARIGPTHISFYAALLQLWIDSKGSCPFLIYRSQVMSLARISGPTTYHKILNDLIEAGYVEYTPGFNRKGSRIFFINKSTESQYDDREKKGAWKWKK